MRNFATVGLIRGSLESQHAATPVNEAIEPSVLRVVAAYGQYRENMTVLALVGRHFRWVYVCNDGTLIADKVI